MSKRTFHNFESASLNNKHLSEKELENKFIPKNKFGDNENYPHEYIKWLKVLKDNLDDKVKNSDTFKNIENDDFYVVENPQTDVDIACQMYQKFEFLTYNMVNACNEINRHWKETEVTCCENCFESDHSCRLCCELCGLWLCSECANPCDENGYFVQCRGYRTFSRCNRDMCRNRCFNCLHEKHEHFCSAICKRGIVEYEILKGVFIDDISKIILDYVEIENVVL